MATVLVATVLRAERLKGKDYFSKSDSYVKLKLADTIKKTKVIMNDSNPEWNQTFELAVKDPETDSLEIAVYDWDKDTRHDLMGTQVINLKQLKPNVLEPFTLNLLKNYIEKDRRKEKNRGNISLELRLEYRQRPLTDSAHGEPNAGDAEVNEEDNVAEETPLTDSAEAIPLVNGEDVEAPTSNETLDKGDKHEDETIDEGKNVEAPTSDEELVKRETADEEAQSPETGEAICC